MHTCWGKRGNSSPLVLIFTMAWKEEDQNKERVRQLNTEKRGEKKKMKISDLGEREPI